MLIQTLSPTVVNIAQTLPINNKEVTISWYFTAPDKYRPFFKTDFIVIKFYKRDIPEKWNYSTVQKGIVQSGGRG